MYHSFGVGAAEVELDCVTGERQLLRCDLMFDAGRSVSPGIDLGQVRLRVEGERSKACRV
jgi:xanthine dehydrogenase molybdopterin-binding subunit B